MASHRRKLAALAAGLGLLLPAGATAAEPATDAAVQRGLERLVAAQGGPPGAIATLHRGGRTTVLRAGRASAERPRKPQAGDHMRIASVAKAFSSAVALRLVQQGKLDLDDTIEEWLPGLPGGWGAVTVRQMLRHTSGLPDYTRSEGFARHAETAPRSYVPPSGIIDWVRSQRLEFPPGSKYEYSNTDNIVVGLIAERVTGRSYGRLLSRLVFAPAALAQTTFPTRRISLPAPRIRGYVAAPGQAPQDVTGALSPSGAWASGAIVSTPLDLAAFMRGYLGRKFFGRGQQAQQMRFVRGSSSPPGPGVNSAGLGIFRYRSRCGTVYGHTGNFPGYVQWAAATADGKRSVTTTLNIPAPTGALLKRLRSVQETAVCALLEGTSVRTIALRRGVTKVDLSVRHRAGKSPPAILLSTAPASLRCSVADYSYLNHERRARFRMAIRCPNARQRASATLAFRAPLRQAFRLRNGSGTVRVEADVPRGDVLPLGRLTTRPRNTDCRVGPARLQRGSRRFAATSQVHCRGLPADAKGVLAVGGLIAADEQPVGGGSARAATARAKAAAIRQGCDDPSTFTVGRESVSWKDCHTGPFTLGPWQTQWVGHIGSTPQFNCESGWTRHIGALEVPVAWLTIGYFRVDLVTDPSDAWAWSWSLGVVTNWQFSGDVTFWWKYRCFRVNSSARG
jgi:D-alanyl-D-alanine carboxypeptidase